MAHGHALYSVTLPRRILGWRFTLMACCRCCARPHGRARCWHGVI